MEEPVSVRNSFDQAGRVTVVTGWPGLLGWKPAEAVAEMGGIPVLLDLHEERCEKAEGHIRRVFGGEALGGPGRHHGERTDMENWGSNAFAPWRIEILINNPTPNPKVEYPGARSGFWSCL